MAHKFIKMFFALFFVVSGFAYANNLQQPVTTFAEYMDVFSNAITMLINGNQTYTFIVLGGIILLIIVLLFMWMINSSNVSHYKSKCKAEEKNSLALTDKINDLNDQIEKLEFKINAKSSKIETSDKKISELEATISELNESNHKLALDLVEAQAGLIDKLQKLHLHHVNDKINGVIQIIMSINKDDKNIYQKLVSLRGLVDDIQMATKGDKQLDKLIEATAGALKNGNTVKYKEKKKENK